MAHRFSNVKEKIIKSVVQTNLHENDCFLERDALLVERLGGCDGGVFDVEVLVNEKTREVGLAILDGSVSGTFL
jgi:hypothetical protein